MFHTTKQRRQRNYDEPVLCRLYFCGLAAKAHVCYGTLYGAMVVGLIVIRMPGIKKPFNCRAKGFKRFW